MIIPAKQVNLKANAFKCPLEINNIVGFSNLLREFNSNNDVIKEYTAKLNTLCYKNNPIVKKTNLTKSNKILFK
jgi:hypothetical protein